jgi:hypothetical protein
MLVPVSPTLYLNMMQHTGYLNFRDHIQMEYLKHGQNIFMMQVAGLRMIPAMFLVLLHPRGHL